MSSLGQSVRNRVRRLISNQNLRTSITITPVSLTEGADGGYEPVTETESVSRTVYAIVDSHAKDIMQLIKFGDLSTGDMRLFVRDDETVDTNDKVTFSGSSYHIRRIEPVIFNEVTIAQMLVLSKRLD